MDKETVVIRFRYMDKEIDIELPLVITAQELLVALNEAYELKIDTTDIKICHLQAENPIVLLKGNKTLKEFGIRNGTIVYYTK